mgnify:CR=1 FL=1
MDLFVENHASVLREKNIMQPEQATTPVRRAFFAAQTIVLENAVENQEKVRTYLGLLDDLAGVFTNCDVAQRLGEIRRLAGEGAIYKSMMMLRPIMTYEDAVFAHGRLMDLSAAEAETRAADARDVEADRPALAEV